MIKSKAFRVCALVLVGLGLSQAPAMAQCGTASWYHEGKVTANGERYKPDGISAAHKSLPFGTRVLVTNKRTGRTVVVRINDRGPFIRGRIIDLSRGAKRVLGMGGLAPVCLTVLGRGQRYADAKTSKSKRVAAKAGSATRGASQPVRKKRVAAKARNAKSRLAARTVYGTTQTSAGLERAEPARKRGGRVAKRGASPQATGQYRKPSDSKRWALKLAGWPRSDRPTI